MGIAAKPTMYNNRFFRSRLEARWAVFYDALGIPYDYEPQDHVLPAGRYLPDFWLPDHGCWIEIKGTRPDYHEGQLCRQLCVAERKPVYIFHTPMRLSLSAATLVPSAIATFQIPDIPGEAGHDEAYEWCECDDCGMIGIAFDARSDRLPHKPECQRCGAGLDKGRNPLSTKLRYAYNAAMSAQFEFGACGAV